MRCLALSLLLPLAACATATTASQAPAPSPDDEALREVAREHTHELAKAVQLYWFVHGEYPSAEEGLRALVHPKKGKPIFRVVPRDPWGQEFGYRTPGIDDDPFDVYSLGPDREPGTADDVGSWEVRQTPPAAPRAPADEPGAITL